MRGLWPQAVGTGGGVRAARMAGRRSRLCVHNVDVVAAVRPARQAMYSEFSFFTPVGAVPVGSFGIAERNPAAF